MTQIKITEDHIDKAFAADTPVVTKSILINKNSDLYLELFLNNKPSNY